MRGAVNGMDSIEELPQLPEARFELVQKLGEGGMAAVYRALDRETHEWVAVKVLLEKHCNKRKIRKRFADEAKAMLMLRHRNVVGVVHVNSDAMQPYFAMELAQGGCVVEWLSMHGAMPPKMATDIAIQVCKGLGAAHRQGVIHRDVKPHNILVNRRGVCKITDFGIAHIDDDSASMTRTGSVLGTLGYIAPEQRTNSKDVDERADVYSVGATLYTMLTARTTMDLFFAEQEPEMMNGIHEALVPILIKATRYRRNDRHDTMRQLAKELYHVKALLPDDPEDTPSLVMNSVEELTDELERLVTPEPTADTPFSSLSTHDTPFSMAPDSMPPGQIEVDTMPSRAVPSTTPGIPRAHLLRDQDASGRRARVRRLAQAAGLAMLPVALLCTVLLGSVVAGRSAIVSQAHVAAEQQDKLVALLEEESAITEELLAIGADRAVVQAAWLDWKAAKGRDQQARVGAMVQRYQRLIAEHQPPAGSSRVSKARSAEARLARIDRALGHAEQATRALDQTAGSLTGQLALAVGAASVP